MGSNTPLQKEGEGVRTTPNHLDMFDRPVIKACPVIIGGKNNWIRGVANWLAKHWGCQILKVYKGSPNHFKSGFRSLVNYFESIQWHYLKSTNKNKNVLGILAGFFFLESGKAYQQKHPTREGGIELDVSENAMQVNAKRVQKRVNFQRNSLIILRVT